MPDLKLKIHMHVSSTDIKSAYTFQEFERKKNGQKCVWAQFRLLSTSSRKIKLSCKIQQEFWYLEFVFHSWSVFFFSFANQRSNQGAAIGDTLTFLIQ